MLWKPTYLSKAQAVPRSPKDVVVYHIAHVVKEERLGPNCSTTVPSYFTVLVTHYSSEVASAPLHQKQHTEWVYK